MKKLLSVIVFAAVIMGMSVISTAAEGATITQDSDEQSGKISVDYNMGVTYIVTIPASVTFTDTEKVVERPLQVTNVIINEGSSLNVNIASLNDFKMKNGDGYIDYYLTINYASILPENNCTILTVEAGESLGWAILSFITELNKENALYAGSYTDTLTFTISID